ncbi:MAG: DUF1622 domain-containing protein [Chloroflexota bacterium]|jgi:uncharacterized membrane protein
MHDLMEGAVTLFEAAGVLVLLVGSAWAVVQAGRALGDRASGAYGRFRRDIGRAILLGLELLIIADIILTVTVEQTLESAATLGVIVIVRTFLSFSLEVELEGVLPWRKRAVAGVGDGERVVDVG